MRVGFVGTGTVEEVERCEGIYLVRNWRGGTKGSGDRRHLGSRVLSR